MYWISIIIGKFVSLISKTFGFGAGATWPGEIALALHPSILQTFAAQPVRLVLVAGTNGKTTTVRMIETTLRHQGLRVAHNESGANLENGLVSAFVKDADWRGKLRSDYYIFEVDEATLPRVVIKLESYKVHKVYKVRDVYKGKPLIVVLLNLFRDQLDRYGEVDTIAEQWLASLINLRGAQLVINADDPQLSFIGSKLSVPVSYFGLEDPSLFLPGIQHATDTIYCPNCGTRLTFGGVYFSHLGKWACGKCGFTHPNVSLKASDFESPIEGVYNKYNMLAAASVCRRLGLTAEQITMGFKHVTPAFGRMETLHVSGKAIKILLSKNPTGFNESLRAAMSAGAGTLLFVLNDRIPDGRDVSWIWDVDFELLAKGTYNIVVSGDRAYDMGLRLKYAGLQFVVDPDLNKAIQTTLDKTKPGETLWILPTYSAMLEVRKVLTGKKIL